MITPVRNLTENLLGEARNDALNGNAVRVYNQEGAQ